MAKARKVPSRQQILEQIEILAVTPFQDVLATLLEGGPDLDSVVAFSKKSPDRWAQSVTQFAKLGGYRPDAKVEIGNIYFEAKQMSDAELMLKLQENMKLLKGVLLEGEAREVVEQIMETGKDKAEIIKIDGNKQD